MDSVRVREETSWPWKVSLVVQNHSIPYWWCSPVCIGCYLPLLLIIYLILAFIQSFLIEVYRWHRNHASTNSLPVVCNFCRCYDVDLEQVFSTVNSIVESSFIITFLSAESVFIFKSSYQLWICGWFPVDQRGNHLCSCDLYGPIDSIMSSGAIMPLGSNNTLELARVCTVLFVAGCIKERDWCSQMSEYWLSFSNLNLCRNHNLSLHRWSVLLYCECPHILKYWISS